MPSKKKLALYLFMLFVLVMANAANGANTDNAKKESVFPRYLEGNEPSYFVFVPGVENTHKDKHIEFFLSIRYPIADEVLDAFGECGFNVFKFSPWVDCMGSYNDPNPAIDGDHKLYFVYAGQYDFFAGSRHSSPIISRRQNPGLTYKYSFLNKPLFLKSIKFSWFHESNGQDLDEELYTEALGNGQNLLTANNQNGLYSLDHISRGWDYAETEIAFAYDKAELYIKYRKHCNCQALGLQEKEDKIFWDTANANEGGIREFKGLDLIANYTWVRNDKIFNRIRLSYKLGTGELSYIGNHLSQKASLTVRVAELPLTLFYFDGYGENLSQYHTRSQYIGVGIELW